MAKYIVKYGCSWNYDGYKELEPSGERQYLFYKPNGSSLSKVYDKDGLVKHLNSIRFFPDYLGIDWNTYSKKYYGPPDETVLNEQKEYVDNFVNAMHPDQVYRSGTLRLNDCCCDVIVMYATDLSHPIYVAYSDITTIK